ncbi:MAG: hypothetical protein WC026_16470 [Hyphomicrobium sp.]|uniref:hypothetical protein n=1 Tax=Hyphomicrobium sp. TaxID=82 RepID=UPI0035634789
MSYATKVYKALGGNELVVESGGKVTLKPGSTLENAGDFFVSVTFDSDFFTVTEGEVTLKAEVAALLTLVDNIPTSDPEVAGQIWSDGGVLKVSAGE